MVQSRSLKSILCLGLSCLVLFMLGSLFVGSATITFSDSLSSIERLVQGSPATWQDTVLWQLRMPRIICGALVGISLACCGVVMQGIFCNPLVDANILGISSGAALGAVLAIGTGLTLVHIGLLPLVAFVGGILAGLCTLVGAAKHTGMPKNGSLLLTGLAVGIFFNALTTFELSFFNETKIQEYLFWLLGSLSNRRWEHVYILLIPTLLATVFLTLCSKQLELLSLGETEARVTGLQVNRWRYSLLGVVIFLNAFTICVCGNLGFVGLIVPHAVRLCLGAGHSLLLPASALAGGCFVVLCDALGRAILPGMEIRVGVMTALVGAPYFFYLLRKYY